MALIPGNMGSEGVDADRIVGDGRLDGRDPGVASMGKVNHFILVPDMGTCCFGGQPKPTDMIEVFVPDGKDRVAYSPRRIKLAGTFYLADVPTKSLGLNNVWYHMEIDQVK